MRLRPLTRSFCLLLVMYFAAASAGAAAITSAGSGPWSLTTTWTGAAVPTAADSVVIAPTHVVTVDITTATASTTTVNGTLSFSRAVSSSFTLVRGDLIVNGTLDMGTAASTIPSGVKAHLVLAYGSVGQYGLIISTGGNFSANGAAKSPYGFAAQSITGARTSLLIAASSGAGWAQGDAITIGPTESYATAAVDARAITTIAGVDPLTISWAGSLVSDRAFASTTPIVVGNLTRNVLIRSSGTRTDTGGNSAYLRTLTPYTTSFVLANAEFAYLGADAPGRYGITFDGSRTRGSISSSTVRDGNMGVYLGGASSVTLSYNNIYRSSEAGIFLLGAANNDIVGNLAYSSLSNGIEFSFRAAGNDSNLLQGNYSYCNLNGGLTVSQARQNRVSDNWVFSNTAVGGGGGGFFLDGTAVYGNSFSRNRIFLNFYGLRIYDSGSTGNVFAQNDMYSNNNAGLFIQSFSGSVSSITVVGGYIYDNYSSYGLRMDAAANITAADLSLGYDVAGTNLPNGSTEISFAAAAPAENLTLKHVRINPSNGIETTGLNRAGTYILSYNQDSDTGSLRIMGDYSVSGATLTLDHAIQLYASAATAPRLMRGSGHVLTVCSTNDANAISQLISTQRVAGVWQVTGSSSGALGTLAPGACPGTAFPAGSPQINLALTQGGSPQDGDALDVVLISASGDAARQKRLLFGRSDTSLNSGRSKLTVAPSGGVVLKGIVGSHALMDIIPGGTYYTFVDSGAFTAQFSSITNSDSLGLQLSGSAGVAISSSVFDFIGIASATNTYITARTLNSTATLTNVTFAASRSTAAPFAYNILVTGADTNLSWNFPSPPLGVFWGEAFNSDPRNKVTWGGGGGNTPPASPLISVVDLSSITVAFTPNGGSSYVVEASTAANFSGTLFVSAGAGSPLTVTSLARDTTYYLRAGALWGATTVYTNTTPDFAVTLASAPAPLNFSGITPNQFSVNWRANSNPVTTNYEVTISTKVDFSLIASSLTTTALTNLFTTLLPQTTYFARVRAVNGAGVGSAYALGAVVTTNGVITISANRLASVWYGTTDTVFNAQGASNFHYAINTVPTYVPNNGDLSFDGSALPTTLPQGIVYFHVTGDNGGASVGTAHFGPLFIDLAAPIVPTIAAQISATNVTPVPDGSTLFSPTPHITWTAPTNTASPIVGYSISLSSEPADEPALLATTILTFTDFVLTQPYVWYVKVRAQNQAGTWGTSTGMSFAYSVVPTASGIILRKNYFNPLRGECASISVQVTTAGHLKVKLYTLLGQLVSSWIDQDVSPGSFSYSWCGRNAAGETVATGGYLLRVEAPDHKQMFKVAVVK